jgi:hypothetical protein
MLMARRQLQWPLSAGSGRAATGEPAIFARIAQFLRV